MERIPIEGIIRIYEIPEEWAQHTALFNIWWQPETVWHPDYGHIVTREAQISDEAKASRLVMEPVHNLITTAGISRMLNNIAVSAQSNMQPIAQILSVGNGALSGVTRADTAVTGDGFASGARKAPASTSLVGFVITDIVNFAIGDAVGTWTNLGFYGGGSATTTTGTGTLYSHALFPLVKNGAAYSVQYTWLMSN